LKRQVLAWLPKAHTTSGNVKIVWRPKILLLAQDRQQSNTATDDQQDGHTSFNSDFPHLDLCAAPSPVSDSLYSTTREQENHNTPANPPASSLSKENPTSTQKDSVAADGDAPMATSC
jgi:hypothetical protein